MSSLDAMEKQQEHLEETRDMYRSLIKEVTLLRFRPDSKRVQIVERALTPREMAFPRIEIVPPLVAILVVGVVAGLVFLRELTDQRVKSASDLQLLAGARVLGVVPDLQEDPCRSGPVELVVRRCPMSVLAESYRQTWTLVEKAMDRAGHRSLLLVGGMPESGSTTVGTNLAATAAATGKRVVMVDANFRRPRLAAVLGVAPDSVGLGDVLTADVDPQDAIASTEFGFDLVPAGRPESRIFERLSNGRLDAMLALLRDRYDLVIMDSPPAIVAGDALAVAGKVDAAVLVVRANQDQRGLVVRLMNQLVEAPSELLGIVLNRPRFTAGGYFRRNFEAMAQYTTPPAA
jgi:capsular exopolysaccharide synthesis family protein